MVGIGRRGKQSSVARATIVNWDGCVVYDKFVKQTEQVTNYRTFVSGITQYDLVEHDHNQYEDDVDLQNNDPTSSSNSQQTSVVTFEQCQRDVQSMIENK